MHESIGYIMNCIFIYNPVSGRGKIQKKLPLVTKSLQEKYDDVVVYATQCPGDMTRVARESVGKFDAIIFSGGDGSFNEVLQGIADFDNLPELGYIPSGTVNDIAHTLHIPRNVKGALRVIKSGKTERLDCMKINNRYAMYVVAAGAFTSATYNTPQVDKNAAGKIAYYVEGIRHNLNFSFFNIDCKDPQEQQYDGMLIAFFNSHYVAGFKMNKDSSLQDGKIEAAIVQEKKKQKSNFLKKFISLLTLAILFLFGKRAKNKNIIHLEGSSFDIDVADDIVWNFDGEKGCNGKIHIEVIPAKVKVIVPKKLKKI